MTHRSPLYWLALGAIASVTLSSCVVSDGYAYREDYLSDGYSPGYYNRPISSGPDYYNRPYGYGSQVHGYVSTSATYYSGHNHDRCDDHHASAYQQRNSKISPQGSYRHGDHYHSTLDKRKECDEPKKNSSSSKHKHQDDDDDKKSSNNRSRSDHR